MRCLMNKTSLAASFFILLFCFSMTTTAFGAIGTIDAFCAADAADSDAVDAINAVDAAQISGVVDAAHVIKASNGPDEADAASGTDDGAGANTPGNDAASDGRDNVLVCGGPQHKNDDSPSLAGPGVSRTKPDSSDGSKDGRKGASLGMFTTTGYCNCPQCNPEGFSLTYSGTVPKAEHTVSADLTLYPVGTKLMVNDIIYTVEDKGSHIVGNWLDIYYDNHEEAEAHGRITQEVFAVEL